MSKLVDKVFGTHSERELKRIMPLVDKVESLKPTFEAMSDSELRDMTRKYKERLAEGETLDDQRLRLAILAGVYQEFRGHQKPDRGKGTCGTGQILRQDRHLVNGVASSRIAGHLQQGRLQRLLQDRM